MGDPNQGIVHIIGPEQGWTQPGMTIVCGDSHTSTHGAFGAIVSGIPHQRSRARPGHPDSPQVRPKTMAVTVEGELAPGVTAKDVALTIIGAIGTGGGIGHIIEYRGSAIRGLSMEGRMTLCNMSIEGGARAGLVAPDEVTFDYVRTKTMHPRVPIGMRPRPTGGRCRPTKEPLSTRKWCSTPPPSRPMSRGAPIRPR